MPLAETRPVFRRAIHLAGHPVGHGLTVVRVALEDDFHHFRLELGVGDGVVMSIDTQALRQPYSLCESARGPLQCLVGQAVSAGSQSLMRAANPSSQCTHLLDMASLACTAAHQRVVRRQYDITVPVRQAGATVASISSDGRELLRWELQDLTIVAPSPCAGVHLQQGFARWAAEHLTEDEAHAALLLRRCALISLGKGKKLDLQIHAIPTGLCYAQQPERAPQALRQVGSTLDFSDRANALCADDQSWLANAE